MPLISQAEKQTSFLTYLCRTLPNFIASLHVNFILLYVPPFDR